MKGYKIIIPLVVIGMFAIVVILGMNIEEPTIIVSNDDPIPITDEQLAWSAECKSEYITMVCDNSENWELCSRHAANDTPLGCDEFR